MPLPLAAERHYAYQQQVTSAVVRAAQLAWARVSLTDLDGSWRSVSDGFTALVTAAQVAAARDADPYLSAVLAEMGSMDAPVGQVQPAAFAGVASDGRGLASLLAEPLITVKTGLKARVAPERALASGGSQLEMLAQTTVQDAGRAAVSAGIVARPHVQGYVRVLTPPSCTRCVILAGRVYKSSTSFQRHPRCFPAGVMVSSPGTQAAARRRYEGELVVMRTASGQELSVTPNHPVLTDCGWVPAGLLQEGDNVLHSRASHVYPVGASPEGRPDHDQVPSLVEDVWRADGVFPVRRVPTSPEDFHGDGGHGEVDVVATDGLLRDGTLSQFLEPLAELTLGIGHEGVVRVGGSATLTVERTALQLFGVPSDAREALAQVLSVLRSAAGSGSSGSTSGLGRVGLSAHPEGRGFVRWADGHTCGDQPSLHRVSSYPVAASQLAGTYSGEVEVNSLADRQAFDLARWDAPSVPFSRESRGVYAARGLDLLDRLSGQVHLDRLVECRRVSFAGHVYSITSRQGWHSANTLIVSNCDCRMLPLADLGEAEAFTTDPMEALRAGQVRGLSKAEEAAISDGADLNQIVNAHREGDYQGMTTAEGVTKRGLAGKRLRGQQRLTVGAIQRLSSDRAEMTALLRAHGYITA